MSKYSVNVRISYMLYEIVDRKSFEDPAYIPIKPVNKNVTITLESDNQEDAIKEIEEICTSVVNKSNQEKLKMAIKENLSQT